MSSQLINALTTQLDSSPTPRHLVRHIANLLLKNGFIDMSNRKSLDPKASKCFIAQAGSIICWKSGSEKVKSGFRIVGAHTDSPCLKVKPHPDETRFGFNTLQVEIYGSPLLNSWLDRDLGIAGEVILSSGKTKLFSSVAPIARISQLAIHLDREVNERGLILDKHLHLSPAWSSKSSAPKFIDWVAAQLKVKPSEIVTFDAQLFDTAQATVLGSDESLLASGRLDNQASCWAAIQALVDSPKSKNANVVALFDHEEVGSNSSTGAAGPLLEHTLERISSEMGANRIQFLEALRQSSCISADNAHAVHPNYPDRHELKNAPIINCGPAIKINSNQRYATSSQSASLFIEACKRAKVKHQTFVSRNSMPCGSTIGPITATRLGIETVDIGIPQLSMHSIREVCGIGDLVSTYNVLKQYFS